MKTARANRASGCRPSGTRYRSSTSRTRPRSTAPRTRCPTRRARGSSTTSSRSPRSSAPRDRSAGSRSLNDWSARDLQRLEMKVGLGPAKGKDFATSLGPIVVTPDEFDGSEAEMVARVNGEERSRGNLRDLQWPWERLLEQAARNTRLSAGRRDRLRDSRHGLHPRARGRPLAAAGGRRGARSRGNRRSAQHRGLGCPCAGRLSSVFKRPTQPVERDSPAQHRVRRGLLWVRNVELLRTSPAWSLIRGTDRSPERLKHLLGMTRILVALGLARSSPVAPSPRAVSRSCRSRAASRRRQPRRRPGGRQRRRPVRPRRERPGRRQPGTTTTGTTTGTTTTGANPV